MGRKEVLSQEQAWRAYDRWLQDERVEYLDEATGLETYFRDLTRSPHSAPKDFDQAFKHKAKELVLLKA